MLSQYAPLVITEGAIGRVAIKVKLNLFSVGWFCAYLTVHSESLNYLAQTNCFSYYLLTSLTHQLSNFMPVPVPSSVFLACYYVSYTLFFVRCACFRKVSCLSWSGEYTGCSKLQNFYSIGNFKVHYFFLKFWARYHWEKTSAFLLGINLHRFFLLVFGF